MPAVMLSLSIVLYFPKHFLTDCHTSFSPQSSGGRQFLPLIKKVGIGEVLVQSQHPTSGFKNWGTFRSVQLLYGEALFNPPASIYVPSFIFLWKGKAHMQETSCQSFLREFGSAGTTRKTCSLQASFAAVCPPSPSPGYILSALCCTWARQRHTSLVTE